MKPGEHMSPDGVRAARALLSLLEEHSAEDFQAAAAILGGQSELSQIVTLLREFKEKHSPEALEPLSVEALRDIVKDKLIASQRNPVDIETVFREVIGTPPAPPPRPFKPPRKLTLEGVVERGLRAIDETFDHPAERVEALVSTLRRTALLAEQRDQTELLLRDLATRAIAENIIVFPTLHAIAQLRTRWAPASLPYSPEWSRQHLAARLFKDAERLAPDKLDDITLELLKEGLRGPADLAIAQMRRMGAE